MRYLGLTTDPRQFAPVGSELEKVQKRRAARSAAGSSKEPGTGVQTEYSSIQYQLQPPATQQFDVADWTQPMYAQPSATTVVSGGAAPTTVLKLGPGQYMDTSTYGPSVDLGAGIRDLYSEAAFKDIERGIELLQRMPAQPVPVQEMYGPSPTPQLPTMASQQQAEARLEQAQAPQPVVMSAAAPAEKKGLGLVWLAVAGVVGLMLAGRGKP